MDLSIKLKKKKIMRLPSSFKDNIDSFKLEYDEKMADFKLP